MFAFIVSYVFYVFLYIYIQGCKIPLARSHWRVNIDGGRVKLAMRSPDRASVFSSSEFVIFQSFGRQNANLTFLKCIPVAGITFLFVNIIHSGTPGNSTGHKDQSVSVSF